VTKAHDQLLAEVTRGVIPIVYYQSIPVFQSSVLVHTLEGTG